MVERLIEKYGYLNGNVCKLNKIKKGEEQYLKILSKYKHNISKVALQNEMYKLNSNLRTD